MMDDISSLTDLKAGQKAVIRELTSLSDMRRRLQDIGLIEGTVVECVGKSPLGDPAAYLIRGAVIALRSEDSGKVLVNCGYAAQEDCREQKRLLAAGLGCGKRRRVRQERKRLCRVAVGGIADDRLDSGSQMPHGLGSGEQTPCDFGGSSQISCVLSGGEQSPCDFGGGSQMSCDLNSSGYQMSCVSSSGGQMSCDLSSRGQMSCDLSSRNQMSCDLSSRNQMSCDLSSGGLGYRE